MQISLLVVVVLLCYFAVLTFWSRRYGKATDNDTFFRARRESSWWMVAVGMVGASMSGVSFVSVPGWVATTHFTYLQMCIGFVVGYAVVAFCLLPLYYRLQLTSIYSYLGIRFGIGARTAGATCFLLCRLTGSAARVYLVCTVLHTLIVAPLHVPFFLTASGTLLLIWLYTWRGGMAVIVRTDVFQTLCMLLSLVVLVVAACCYFPGGIDGAKVMLHESQLLQVFEWEVASPQAFWRQFLSGVLIVVAMTGLDQDMMQKNLTCRTLRDAQKNMLTNSLFYLPVNALLLLLGALLYLSLPTDTSVAGDHLLPHALSSGIWGEWTIIPFAIALAAATLSSADSALTSLTTCCCIDLLRIEEKTWSVHQQEGIRRFVHASVAVIVLLLVLLLEATTHSQSIIDVVYRLASYTYGPLLALFGFGLFSRRQLRVHWLPYAIALGPLACLLLDFAAPVMGYETGYELLLVNAGVCACGLWSISFSSKHKE